MRCVDLTIDVFCVFQTVLFDPHQTSRVEAPGGRTTVGHHCGQDAGQCGSQSCQMATRQYLFS